MADLAARRRRRSHPLRVASDGDPSSKSGTRHSPESSIALPDPTGTPSLPLSRHLM